MSLFIPLYFRFVILIFDDDRVGDYQKAGVVTKQHVSGEEKKSAFLFEEDF